MTFLGQTFTSTLHIILSRGNISAKFALLVCQCFLFSKAQTELQTSANVIQNGSFLQMCHILVLNGNTLLCGNFPMAGAL